MSNLRLRDSINKIEDLINYAGELGHKIVGITDHESTGNWVKAERIYKKIKEKYPNLKIIRGNEIYLVRNGLNADNFNKDFDKYFHFILIARDLEGAHQIMEISTRAWRRSYIARGMRRVPTYYQDLIDIIGTNPGHVIGSTACLGGALPTQILRGTDEDKLKKWIQQMADIFGRDNFFLEMQPSKNNDQIKVNRKLLEFANYFNLGYIITTDSHYLKKEDREVHKAYLNAQGGEREVDDFYATTYMMDTEELESYMKYSFNDTNIIRTAYVNINRIAEMCEDFSILKPLRIPDLAWKQSNHTSSIEDYYNKIPYLRVFMESDYYGDHHLCDLIIDGIESHPDLQNDRAYAEIDSNLEMTWISSKVNNAHWSAYYMNLQKIIDLCWEAGSLVGPGRGSGVGFILLYVLGITQINPLRETTRCFSWRFLNPERVSVLDVDFDIEGGRRADVLSNFRKFYGDDRVANVATFRTEKSKSAILTAARGLGIDVDIAQYIASLIPSDRGQLRSLDQCMYGDTENDWDPIKSFVFEMNENYPELWRVARSIEGLICGSGIHAGGVIFVDEPFTKSCGLMRAPDGTICTQFELHDCQAVSLIKYDALSVEAMDKIHNCIDLICDNGYAIRNNTLKETYENLIGIYNLERDDQKMWKMVWEHKIQSLFQMEGQTGIQGLAQLHPTSVDDLAILNSTLRLMAQEKGGEMPTAKLARFKAQPDSWDKEIESFGLDVSIKKILEPVLGMSYGLCIAQEQFMELVQLPELGGFSLTWADKLRKSIAKKNPKEYNNLSEEFYKVTSEKNIDQKFAHYVWDVLIAMSKGYGFNQSHTLAYSLIALQEMNLAYKYPIMFWNCACLISDAGGKNELNQDTDDDLIEENKVEETYSNEMEEFGPDDSEEDVEDSYDEDEDCDGFPVEICKMRDGKKKKKIKNTNYGKVATAIGKIKQTGVVVSAPDINTSSYNFSPDIKNNTIRHGLSGITRIGEDLITEIIKNRPYSNIEDFLLKVKINKPQMVNLIKSGAFSSFGETETIMHKYVDLISDTKKRITLQNMKMLIDFGLIPEEFDMVRRVFNFNKYIKKMKLDNIYYGIDEIGFQFYSSHFNIDWLERDENTESGFKIKQTGWDNIYQSYMDKIRPWVKANSIELLNKVNTKLTSDLWDKYCSGTINKWDMDSLSCYLHGHELDNVAPYIREDWADFFKLSEQPEIDRIIKIKDKQIPIFKLYRIAGTVLDRDKSKKLVTLLTETGVVTVKIWGAFEAYDKQISEKDADGHKHIIEKSAFARGNKIIVTGIRNEDSFIAKVYKTTPYHRVEIISNINDDGTIEIRNRGEE